jgi:hypothetical protein
MVYICHIPPHSTIMARACGGKGGAYKAYLPKALESYI